MRGIHSWKATLNAVDDMSTEDSCLKMAREAVEVLSYGSHRVVIDEDLCLRSLISRGSRPECPCVDGHGVSLCSRVYRLFLTAKPCWESTCLRSYHTTEAIEHSACLGASLQLTTSGCCSQPILVPTLCQFRCSSASRRGTLLLKSPKVPAGDLGVGPQSSGTTVPALPRLPSSWRPPRVIGA